ncbi:ABC transporter permease [Georgenia sp. Z1344]|uniref:ABC transporter permease n=1 Tax=Georgenia sp. Z1344 TaxID=3416706 RepID=UPI003CF3E4E8
MTTPTTALATASRTDSRSGPPDAGSDGSRRGHALGDLALLTHRSLLRELRQVDGIIVSLLLPVMITLAFVYVFGGAIDLGGSDLSYVDFVAPAIVVLAAGYGAANTAVGVAEDMTGGIVDRFRTLPVASWTVPSAYVVASVVRNLVTTAVALLTAVAVGFRPAASPSDWLLVLALVTGYILALSALGVVWGLLVRSAQAAGAFAFFALFLPYASDAFVPAESMPGALRVFAEHQPMTPVVQTLRGLLLDQPVGDAGWLAALWLAGATLVGVVLAASLFRRRARG